MALLLWLAPLPTMAAYQPLGAQFREGAWSGGAYSDAAGRQFASCAAQATLADGLFVLFELTRDGSFRIGMAHDSWQVTPGSRSPVTLKLDGVTARQDQAEGQQGLFVVTLERDKPLVDALKSARRLELVGSSSAVSIELAGSGGGRALARLEDCLLREAGVDASGVSPVTNNPFAEVVGPGPGGSRTGQSEISAAPSNPFGGAPSTGADSGTAAALAEFIPTVTSFLKRAGLEDATVTVDEDKLIYGWGSRAHALFGWILMDTDRGGPLPSRIEEVFFAANSSCANRAADVRDLGTASGGIVHSGRIDCGKGGSVRIYFVVHRSGGQMLTFMIFSEPKDEHAAVTVMENLRRLLSQI